MTNKLGRRSDVRIVDIGTEADQQRIDNYLFKTLKGVPKSRIYQMVRKGEVRVNGRRIKASYRLSMGDSVRLPPVRQALDNKRYTFPTKQCWNLTRRILYEDSDLLVLNKPTGLAVHGGSGIGLGVIESLRLMLPQEKNLELAHRLDRETSGLLLIAKKRAALKLLHALLRDTSMRKSYLALLAGCWHEDQRICDLSLRKNILRSGERIVITDTEGKSARTHFKVLRRFSDAMLVEAKLETGRTHQIRVHAQALQAAIAGDHKYGDAEKNKHFRQLGLRRLFLHAWRLAFPWKNTGTMRFEASLDAELEHFLATLSA